MLDYTGKLEDLCHRLSVDPAKGLTSQEAEKRLNEHGKNQLEGKKHKNVFQKFLDQMKDFMVIILIVAALISFGVALYEGKGDFLDSIIIIAIVILNGILGVSQESKAEKSLDALQSMAAPNAKVLRDGVVSIIPSAEIVPGDIVMLDAGDFIPADGRIINSASLQCEESALTGESVPVEKHSDVVIEGDVPIGDRINMVYSGTAVTYGRGQVIITDTGMDTEMGKIASLLSSAEPELTPLQVRLNQMGKYLGIMVLGICAVIFALGYYQSNPADPMGMRLLESFMTSVSLAVAAIPEGLTAVVTIVLAIGVQKMVKENALIRRLPAVETLGSASVICSDKTGTLTQNRMTVQQVWASDKVLEDMSPELTEASLDVLEYGTLCSDGTVTKDEDGNLKHIGDPTETAIVAAALENGITKESLESQYERVGEIPFDSTRKLMTTIHKIDGKIIAITKGGMDALLPRCKGGDYGDIEIINETMGSRALRVLAVGIRELNEIPSLEECTSENIEKDITFIGLIGMIDPPREESKHAVEECRKAGITTVMITGDHVITAKAIAKELGILKDGDLALTGQELLKMTDQDLLDNVHKYKVYARVSPEDKIRIVQAWQARGEVVAMTGDGVNDAPALKAADIGCAMGITGTDVSKDAADMVLTDDNFATIVTAVKNGRGVYDNILKTIKFLLGSNLGEVFTVFVSLLLGWNAPLLPIHLLLVNIVTDALPALALGVEPTEDNVMDRAPIRRDQSIFANGLGIIIFLCGIMVGSITLIAFHIGAHLTISQKVLPSYQVGMTMAFLVLAISQLVQAWNCRSEKSIFKYGLKGNPTMVKAFLISLTVVLLITLVPPLEVIFKVVDLSLIHWFWVIVLSLSPILFMEIGKVVARVLRRNKRAKELGINA